MVRLHAARSGGRLGNAETGGLLRRAGAKVHLDRRAGATTIILARRPGGYSRLSRRSVRAPGAEADPVGAALGVPTAES
jgi:hypothetical protein